MSLLSSLYLSQAALALAASYGIFIVYQGYHYIFPSTVLHELPGPPKGHCLFGDMNEVFDEQENGSTHKKWMEKYGHVMGYHEFLNVCHSVRSTFIFISHFRLH
jgi:hypothetical protein